MSKVKSLQRHGAIKAYIDLLKTSGFPYTLKISNYTIEIISELFNIQFVKELRGKQTFAAYSKVKKDVKAKRKPIVNKSELKYFEHDFTKDFSASHVINVDLRSAYATILFNERIISEDTFNYLQDIPKVDRLAAVGMLASKKYCFSYNEKNELINYDKITSDLENFFFYCVMRTGNIMADLKRICGADYLFTWVDGIYLRVNDERLYRISDYLEKHYFNYTIEILEDFEVRIVNGKIKLQFKKEDDLKQFNIPAKENMLAADLVRFLTNQNIHDENSYSSRVVRGKRA